MKLCKRGHDTDEVGLRSDGRCAECKREQNRRWHAANAEKARAACQRYREQNREKIRADNRRHSRRFRGIIGVPPEPPPGAPCGICKRPILHTPHADHDHQTGQFRGWLCSGCNGALGYHERPGWKEAAEAYLKAAKSVKSG